MVAASDSPELLSTAESIQAQLRLCFLSYPHSEDLHARFAADHHAIADQLASGQPTRAADLLHEYLDASFAAVVGALELHDA
nr:FCD domain-containing protein [Corynebacterium lactis]